MTLGTRIFTCDRIRDAKVKLKRIGMCAGADIMMQLDDVVGTTVCDEVCSKSTTPLIVILHLQSQILSRRTNLNKNGQGRNL